METTAYGLFARIAIDEIEQKFIGTTQQLLEIHSVEYVNDLPRILEIDEDESFAKVYFPIVDESFYFVIYISKFPHTEIIATGTEPHVSVYLRATSSTLTYNDICKLTKLIPTDGWSLGDTIWPGNSSRKFTSVQFEPSFGPSQFPKKLEKLLDFIEQDTRGVANLVNSANAYVQVAMEFHNGNTMLGGPAIAAQLMRRLAELQLDIDFDIYANGTFFNEA